MARRMVGDGQEIYRVVITRRHSRDNPDWVRGRITPDNPRVLWDGGEYDTHYGPYNSIGAARGQLTVGITDAYGGYRNGIVAGWIEKATVTWERVD